MERIMTGKRAARLVLSAAVFAILSSFVAAQEPTVPVRDSREPLCFGLRKWAFAGPLAEGRRILLDKDSWPRKPADIVDGPRVEPAEEGGFWISFELDGFDDIWLYAADPETGESAHTIVAGVLGSNAPEPLQKDALKQRVFWDGKTVSGKAVGDGAEIRLAIGCEPTFERFIGYRKEQLMEYPIALEVDAKGRVYVGLHAQNRSEPPVLRFDRDGNYIDMVHPAKPGSADFDKMKDWYKYAEMFEGEPLPTMVKAFGNPHFFRWAGYVRLPFRIGPNGDAYIMHGNLAGWQFGLMHHFKRDYIKPVDDLERFYAMAFMPFTFGHMGGSALDGKGHAYFGMKATERPHKSNGKHYIDPNAVATVYKVDLKTGAMAGAFTFNGKRKRGEPSPYLGTAQWVPGKRHWDYNRTEPDPALDSDERFVDICDLAVDDADNILVADGYPRRVKMYRQDGSWIGELTGVQIDGKPVGFYDIVNIRTGPGALYVLAVLRDGKVGQGTPARKPEATHLIKFAGRADALKPSWIVPLHAKARCLAVDRWAPKPIIWVGSGGGDATLSRIEDLGDRASAVKQVGGPPRDGVFVAPELIALDAKGTLFVYDYGRGRLVRTNDDGSEWTETRMELPEDYRDAYYQRRGVMVDDLRGAQEPSSLRVDRRNNRLLLAFERMSPTKGFLCYDTDLKPLKPFLPKRTDGKNSQGKFWSNRGQVHLAVDPHGNIHVSDTDPKAAPDGYFRKDSWTAKAGDLYGGVCVYAPDGTMIERSRYRTFFPAGAMAFDSRGSLYMMDLVFATNEDVGIWFPDETDVIGDLEKNKDKPLEQRVRKAEDMVRFKRGGKPVYYPSDIGYLVKFPAGGGVRNTESELWAHRGVGIHYGSQCHCSTPGDLITVDGADRIVSCDGARRLMKVYDTAGNLIARFGHWGNAETVPDKDGKGEVGFFQIQSMDSVDNKLYVVDKALRRVAKFSMRYRKTVSERR
jgi:hypothetical protein